MLIYNETSKVDREVYQQWLIWMLEEHVPEVMASGHFEEYRVSRLLDQDETEGITYIIQYVAPSRLHYETYLENYAPQHRQKSNDIWGNRVISFRTLMEVIN